MNLRTGVQDGKSTSNDHMKIIENRNLDHFNVIN